VALLAQSKPGLLKGLTTSQVVGRTVFAALVLLFLAVGAKCLLEAVEWINRPFPGFLLNERLVVTGIGRPHWTGTEARLGYPDRITHVNGVQVNSVKELNDVVQRTPVGQTVTYVVSRNNGALTLAIPTMLFGFDDFLNIFVLYFLTGLFYGLCATLVFIMKPDQEVSWAFFLATFFAGLYSLVNFDVIATHQGCIRLYLAASALFPAGTIHLSLIFPEPHRLTQRFPFIKWIPYAVAAALIALLQVLYPRPEVARVYRVVTIFTLVCAASLVISALQAFYTSSSAIARQRAKVVLFGAALALPLPALANVLTIYNVAFVDVKFFSNPWLRLPLIIFPASISYAIIKHNLFDIDVYIKRTVGYGIMTFLVGSAYFVMQLVFRTAVVWPIFGEYSEQAYPVIFALLVVFLFNPINRKVQYFVDRTFFRTVYDYKKTVSRVTEALTTVLNLTEVINRIITALRKEMFIDTAGVVLLDPHKKTCRTLFITDGPNVNHDLIQVQHLPQQDPLLALICREKKIITHYDLQEDPRYQAVREACLRRFQALGASLVMPLIFQDEVKGVLVLGYKKSGHFYTRDDIDLLQTLANQGASAIENAQLADQIKKEETVRTNLARYLSPQVVDDILSHDVQVRLEGELKEVTILISDIRDFVKLTTIAPHDRLVKVLNEYFTEMVRIIFEHQGSIDKFVGDSLVAVFGSLIPLRNSARHAVVAATQMMQQMPILNHGWKTYYHFPAPLEVGIGIGTGEVYLGNVGSPERMEFTIIGDAVNIASRFSTLAQARQILITRETLDRLGPGAQVRELPSTEVRGKEGLTQVFEVLYTRG